MSSIVFSADLDLSKMEDGIRRSNKSIAVWVQEAITRVQKLEKEIQELNKIIDTTPIGSGNVVKLVDQWKEKTAQLNKEKATLVELQKMEVEQNGNTEESQKGIISSLIAWGAKLGIVTAAITFLKNAITSTDKTADTFEETIGLLTGGLQGLYRTIATGQWEQLITNIVNTATATRDLKRATNELNDIVAGNQIRKAKLETGLQQARENAAAATDPKLRQQYFLEAIDFQERITELNKSELRKRLTIDEDYYFTLTGHSKQYYDYLLTQIPTIAENYERYYNQMEGWQLRLNQLKIKEKELGTWGRDADGKAILLKTGLTEADKKEQHQLELLIYTLQDYKILKDDLSKKDQWDKYLGGVASLISESARGSQALVRLTNQARTAGIKASAEGDEIKKQIEEQKNLLAKAVDSKNDAEIKSIAAKIKKLEEELAVRQKLSRQIIEASGYENFIPTKINSAGIEIPSVLSQPKKKTVQQKWTDIQDEMENLAPNSSEWLARNKKILDHNFEVQKKINDAVDLEREKRDKTFNSVLMLTNQLATQLGFSEELVNTIDALLRTYKDVKEGDYESAIVTNISLLISMLGTTDKLTDQITQSYAELARLQRASALAEREGGRREAYENELAQLKKIVAEQEKIVAAAKKKKDNKIFGFGTTYEEYKNAYIEAQKEWENAKNSLQDLEQEYNDFITGGITKNSIADILIQGFREGKTGVDDFAAYMNDVLTNAVLQTFTDSLLSSEKMTAYIKWLKTAMEGGITPEEATLNAQKMADLAIENKAMYDSMTSGLKLNNAFTQPGLTSQIQRSITEETGSELAGLFRRFADDARISRDYTLTGINHLVGIEKNTFNTVLRLDSAILELHTISMNTSATFGTSPKL
jgi:hypothetical protein